MDLSNRGLQAIIQREGVILHAYQDTVGVWTIGTGHTSAAGPPKVTSGMVITKQQNDTILRNDLAPVIQQANANIKVKVTQNQFDAIVSIVFNVGPSFWRSTSIKKLNAGDVSGAAAAIMQWSKPSEIIGRRRSEQKQFLTPDPVINAPKTTVAVVAGAAVGTAAATTDSWWDHALTFTHTYWPYGLGALAAGLAGFGLYTYFKDKN